MFLFLVLVACSVCVQFFWRRRTLMARPMIKEAGMASLLLENPYYILFFKKKKSILTLRNQTKAISFVYSLQ